MTQFRRAIYPGTFDPPHRGHLDLIERGRALVDELVVAVAVNPEKRHVFTQAERVELLQTCTAGIAGTRVVPFDGLVVDLLRREDAQFILRGIRTFADFEAEYSMALMNRQLAGSRRAETLFVLPTLDLSHYSSRWVKEVAAFGGDVREMIPPVIANRVAERLRALRAAPPSAPRPGG